MRTSDDYRRGRLKLNDSVIDVKNLLIRTLQKEYWEFTINPVEQFRMEAKETKSVTLSFFDPRRITQAYSWKPTHIVAGSEHIVFGSAKHKNSDKKGWEKLRNLLEDLAKCERSLDVIQLAFKSAQALSSGSRLKEILQNFICDKPFLKGLPNNQNEFSQSELEELRAMISMETRIMRQQEMARSDVGGLSFT